MQNHIHEECGVFGIFAKENKDVAALTYYGLYALQHRGQEGCGIAVNDDGVITSHKDVGLVSEVFTPQVLEKLGQGSMAVGHTRYGTAGTKSRANCQPMVVNHIKGRMALAHNGNLVNATELRRSLELQGSIFHTTTDTEVISYVVTKERLTTPSIEAAVSCAMYKIEGAYSLVLMSPTKLIAARDPFGFHPLCYGEMEDGTYVVASETCALDSVHARFVRDIEPGEILVFTKDGIRSMREHCGTQKKNLCVFEHIYFARPDSIVDGVSVHEARVRAGRCLAKRHPVEADVVIGVPDSGLDAALGYAQESGIPYEVGFIKNKYIGRTFIAPGQSARENLVRIKLNPVSAVVKGKRVVMIDDSIVRGTTSARIVKLLREAGAAEVHVRSSAPPFMNPCYYGVDIDSRDRLIACRHTVDEIAEIIGADTLGYLPVEDVGELMQVKCGEGYCHACFDGAYPTREPEVADKNRFDSKISEGKKK